MKKRIYLDLDGVMADFDAHFPAVFGHSHKGMPDDDMWSLINSNNTFFFDMPPCLGAVDFFKWLEQFNPIILTACPKSDYANVAVQKRQWVHKHLSKDVTVLPVLHGRFKWLFMHAPGDILIDDYKKNIGEWETNRGVGILHRNFHDTYHALKQAMLDELGYSLDICFDERDYYPPLPPSRIEGSIA